MFLFKESDELRARSRFHRHTTTLILKCYLQRQRRWRLLLVECTFGLFLFVVSVYIAKPVLLAPIQAYPHLPITSADLDVPMPNIILGYAPNIEPYTSIIAKASTRLQNKFISGATEDDLNTQLYERTKGTPVNDHIIWIIFKPKYENMWKLSIRSTDRARRLSDDKKEDNTTSIAFLRIQKAISHAILEYAVSPQTELKFDISMRAMPVSPLMKSTSVRIAISGILLCYTLALIPPVIETQALVVHETLTRFKRALLIRNVSYSAVYVAWLVYAYLTVLPICVLGAIVLILIFRWIHLLYALTMLLSYVSVMIMLALIMAMFHNTAIIACLWSTLFTLLQTFLAEVLVQHGFDHGEGALSFLSHVILPPLGLIHGFNQFALLQTGRPYNEKYSLIYTVLVWTIMNVLYFALLMLLQRTVGHERAIGGQVSWKSIIFKKVEDENQLRPIDTPTGKERENLQEVDELVAKAISFRNVSKSIMNTKVLKNVTLDIYRGEFTMMYIERIQAKTGAAIEDLLAGLSFADEGTINVLGKIVTPDSHLMSVPNMMGYCHRSIVLVDDLTVLEHLNLFIKLCLWNESNQFVTQYSTIRLKRILMECDLELIKHEYIENLDMYYRAQLCWAIALLLEPRIVIIPNFTDSPNYIAVIRDKVMQYKKNLTIVKMCYATIQLQFADRIFLFDSKILIFGGTPAYMFFKYGRDYRIRMTFRGGGAFDNDRIAEFLENVEEQGATVRANLGSLIILRMPASPTANVAALVKHVHENAAYYGVTSFSISLPDSEEVFRRAINDLRALRPASSKTRPVSNRALRTISEPEPWVRTSTACCNMSNLKWIGWKYFSFFVHYRFYLILTAIAAIVSGVLIGLSLSKMLSNLERDKTTSKMIHGEILTVEALEQKSTLLVRFDSSDVAKSIAAAYVLSETNSTRTQIAEITYTALQGNESLTEYLVMRAIDSPQHYVYKFAYGMHVSAANNELKLIALFSPLHKDKSAASRSLARVYMALIRHFTDTSDATIQITDDPLSLDSSTLLKYASPPLVIQFLLIITMSHVTLIPSKEYGLIRHMQSHAANFSPIQYWFTLYFCDLILYWLLVPFVALAMVGIMLLTLPMTHFRYSDLLVVPFMLTVYGLSCVPQAYMFSRGPRASLNAMTFIIINIIFGEATVVAKLFYNLESHVLYLMRMWPQFNMGYALVKIRQIFLYNSECVIFKNKKLCSAKTLHKCCEKCGVLQDCYTDRHYLTTSHGILNEVIAMLIMAVIFMLVILLWEYQLFHQMWRYLLNMIRAPVKVQQEHISIGLMREKMEVQDKLLELKSGRSEMVNTFGESLLCANITKKELGEYVIKNIYFGIGRGEALALSGLKRHGRVQLAETLAGLITPSSGQLWAKAKWKLSTDPHQYCRQVSIACLRDPLPLWMTVYDALELLAILRGVPKKYVADEIWKFVYALELHDEADTLICHIPPHERTRLNFAAAVIGAPSVIIVDECTTYQKYSVSRAMYYILYHLKRRGHAIYISSHSIESHMPITNRLGILLDGKIFDVDLVDNLIARYSQKGYTVAVHLKDEVNVKEMFRKYFKNFVINDTTDVLVNIQVMDDIKWVAIFEKMEELQANNSQVYSYIVTSIPIDYIYNSIIVNEMGNIPTGDLFSCNFLKRLCKPKPRITPTQATLDNLIPFENKYEITRLKELPWSVIFHT